MTIQKIDTVNNQPNSREQSLYHRLRIITNGSTVRINTTAVETTTCSRCMNYRKRIGSNFNMLNHSSQYVGLDQEGSAQDSSSIPMPKSNLMKYAKVALCLAFIRVLYAFKKELAILGLIVFVGYAAYQMNTQTLQDSNTGTADEQMRLRMERIDREREESEAMVQDAARMMKEINQRHLEEYLITHPSATYESWIAKLHPENVDGETIDHRFYVEDSDHRILWNENLEGIRDFVEARSSKQDVETATGV